MGNPIISKGSLNRLYQHKKEIQDYTEEDLYMVLKYGLYSNNTSFLVLHNIHKMLEAYKEYQIKMLDKGEIYRVLYEHRFISEYYLADKVVYTAEYLKVSEEPLDVYRLTSECIESFYKAYLGSIYKEYKTNYEEGHEGNIFLRYPKYWYYVEMYSLHGTMSFYMGKEKADEILTWFDNKYFKWIDNKDYEEFGKPETITSLCKRVREFGENKEERYMQRGLKIVLNG